MKPTNEIAKVNIFDSADAVAESIAQQWLDLSTDESEVHISLSGGSTPKHVFSWVAQSDFADRIDWQNLHFWWGDERCVAADNEQSNFGEAMRLLFGQVSIPSENLHPIHGELPPENACIAFRGEMDASLTQSSDRGCSRPDYDWIILGVGEDGHTASLFPGMTDYEVSENAVVASHPDGGQQRVSLTAPAICAAKRITYLALGSGKKQVVADILNKASCAVNYPAANIVSTEGSTEWYLDAASAGGLASQVV